MTSPAHNTEVDDAMSISPQASVHFDAGEIVTEQTEKVAKPSEISLTVSQSCMKTNQTQRCDEEEEVKNRPSSLPSKPDNNQKKAADGNAGIGPMITLNPWGKLPPLGHTSAADVNDSNDRPTTQPTGTVSVASLHAAAIPDHLIKDQDVYLDPHGNVIRRGTPNVLFGLIEFGVIPPVLHKSDIKKCLQDKGHRSRGERRPDTHLGPEHAVDIHQKELQLRKSQINLSKGRNSRASPFCEKRNTLKSLVGSNPNINEEDEDDPRNSPVSEMDIDLTNGNSKSSLIVETGGGYDHDVTEAHGSRNGRHSPLKKSWSHLLAPGTGAKREPSPFPHFVDKDSIGERAMDRCMDRMKAAEDMLALKHDPFSERYKPYQRLPRGSKKRKGASKLATESSQDNESSTEKARLSSTEKHKHKLRERRERAKAKHYSAKGRVQKPTK